MKINKLESIRILIICFVCVQLSGQNKKIDSLSNLIRTDKQDTTKIKHLNRLAKLLCTTNPDTALILSGAALSLATSLENKNTQPADQINIQKALSQSLSNLGVFNGIKGNYPAAIDCFLKALKLNESLNDKKNAAANLSNIGNLYSYQIDFVQALKYYLKALKINEELGDKNNIGTNLGNIGNVYNLQSDFANALVYYSKALKIKEELGDQNGIQINLGNIGAAYADQAAYISTRNNRKEWADQLDKALSYFLKALNIAEQLGDKNRIGIWSSRIGELYTNTANYKEAEFYLLKAVKIDREIGARNEERQSEAYICDLYEKTNRYKEALHYYKNSVKIKDSLFNAENKKQLIEKEMSFEFEKKEIASRAAQEKQDAIAEEEKQKQKMFLLSVSIVLVLVAVFALLMYRRFKITQKQKQIIEFQKEEVSKQKTIVEEQKHILEIQKDLVEEKQKEIIDSIHYAKRIQTALLTSEKYIDRNLNKLNK